MYGYVGRFVNKMIFATGINMVNTYHIQSGKKEHEVEGGNCKKDDDLMKEVYLESCTYSFYVAGREKDFELISLSYFFVPTIIGMQAPFQTQEKAGLT